VKPSRTLFRIATHQYHIRKSKLQLSVNGIDTVRFTPGPGGEIRRRLGVDEVAVLFLYVGGLRPEKNLAFLLRSFAEARQPNARLVLVGDGACRAELENIAAQLGIAGQVVFAGAASDPLPFYRAADAFL